MRIGIIGAGQLGLMLGEAARELGHTCAFIDPSATPPAASTGPVIQAAFDDNEALARLAADCDVLTYEFENVSVESLQELADRIPVYPPPDALRQAQDRLNEKQLFEELGIPLAPYRRVDSRQGLVDAASELGLPIVVKTRRFGYDGKGQSVVRTDEDIDDAWNALGEHPLIAESWVPFEREVSIIGARGTNGSIEVWPLTENRHIDGILHTSIAPAGHDSLAQLATEYVQRLLRKLDYVGVLALELFVQDGNLLANEFAPRVHNSGHWTIEGCRTSQFANHLIAVSGEVPAAAVCQGHSGMLNLIGDIHPSVRELPADRYAVHDYGKQPRPGRKLGHITIVAESAAERDHLLADLAKTVT